MNFLGGELCENYIVFQRTPQKKSKKKQHQQIFLLENIVIIRHGELSLIPDYFASIYVIK